jgi:hypothetical protein
MKEIDNFMHSFGANKGTIFHFNSDFSGNVIIRDNVEEGKEIEIPGEDILEFVAYCYVQNKKIGKLENATVDELLI